MVIALIVKRIIKKMLYRKKRHQQIQESQANIHHSNRLTLQNLKSGDEAEIVALHGGPNFIRKAESLGIREGLKIKVISAQILHGPLTVQVGHTKIAIGHGMAYRIEVKK